MRIFVELEKKYAEDALAVLVASGFEHELTASGEEFTEVTDKPERVMAAGTMPVGRLKQLAHVTGVVTWQLAEQAP